MRCYVRCVDIAIATAQASIVEPLHFAMLASAGHKLR